MIDLSSLIRAAGGGEGVAAIGARFGLSPEQAQGAVNALLPAIEMGLRNAARTGAAGAILSQMADPVHEGGGEAGAAAAGPVLGGLFGGHGATDDVAGQAAAQSGVPAPVVRAMLPMVVSAVLGGLIRGARNGAFGGAVGGILASVLGGPMSRSAGAAPSEGGIGGLIGGVLGDLLGGDNAQAPARSDDASPGGPGPAPASATPESILDELSALVRSGTPPAPGHEERLAAIIGR